MAMLTFEAMADIMLETVELPPAALGGFLQQRVRYGPH